MRISPDMAKEQLDIVIRKGRTDLYKPIQIAEVLLQLRTGGPINVHDLDSYRNPSLRWRDEVTRRLSGKTSTSSARYQHDVWNDNAMPRNVLAVLSDENRKYGGAVERYIYLKYSERQGAVAQVLTLVEAAKPESFEVADLLTLFEGHSGISRSIDKAYEIVTYSLFETVVRGLEARLRIEVSVHKKAMLEEFSDLARVLLGLTPEELSWEQPAHLYRVGVTNSADMGIDMWANFGPAVQVKHISLNPKLATRIVDQIESDHIVIVCRDADASTIQTVLSQTGWGRRVRGLVTQANLSEWYNRCLRGRFASELGSALLERLRSGFKAEFPQARAIGEFIKERGYLDISPPPLWDTPIV